MNARLCSCSPAKIRAWARRDGISVADRGRLPWQVHALYHAAHPGTEPVPEPVPGPGTGPRGVFPRAGMVSLLALSTTVVLALPAAADEGPALVQVTGAPLVHHFDLQTPGDEVTGLWQVAAASSGPVPYDGLLAPSGATSESLARALHVQYGQLDPDGRVAAWHDAGTLADPVSYAQALPAPPLVGPGAPVSIPVRVSLPDPEAVTGYPGQALSVEAAFTVSYLGTANPHPAAPDPGTAPDAGPGSAGTTDAVTAPGHLAITGLSSWLAALAAAFLTLGVVLRRGHGDRDSTARTL